MISPVWNRMSTSKDLLIAFLLELLKEEREHRRKETEENASLIRDLMSRFEKLEADLILERHTRNLYRRVGRTICDGDVDEVDLWQYVTSGLCNHSLISYLGFPTTKIRPWHQWCCSLIGHHYADLSTWCNTLIRHDKTRKTGRRRQCADRQWTFINKQVSIASEVCGL